MTRTHSKVSFYVTSNIRGESLCHFELNHLVNVLSTRDSSRALKSTHRFAKGLASDQRFDKTDQRFGEEGTSWQCDGLDIFQ